MFVLLFLLSVVNMGMGYALAVYLGFGPPSLRGTWSALGIERPPAADESTNKGSH